MEMPSDKPTVLDKDLPALRSLAETLGQPAYRADQLADWVYRKFVTDPAGMVNLPKRFASAVTVLTSRVARRADSTDGTIKLLVELCDGERIETVLIPSARRATACVSTQVGCAMGCAFCASGADGVRRNLTAGEILEQIVHLQQAGRRRVTNVVFMGMGEPLANYKATVAAIRGLIDPGRFGISARHVTVSTVGLPRQIRKLGRTGMPVTLAISLHAPHDVRRRLLPPAAAAAPLDEIIDAAREFYQHRKREVTLEYVLLAGVNDTPVCAEALARIAKQLRCNVNLIRYNPAACAAAASTSTSAGRGGSTRMRRAGSSGEETAYHRG